MMFFIDDGTFETEQQDEIQMRAVHFFKENFVLANKDQVKAYLGRLLGRTWTREGSTRCHTDEPL